MGLFDLIETDKDYNKAIRETINFVSQVTERDQAFKNLAVILEAVRSEIEKEISVHKAYKIIKGVFPE